MAPRSSAVPTGPTFARLPMSRRRHRLLQHLAPLSLARGMVGRGAPRTLRRTLPAPRACPAATGREVRDVRRRRPHRIRPGRPADHHRRVRDVRGRRAPASGRCSGPPTGEILRSNAFTLTVTGAGRRVTRLVADGAGAGHGVGFCQWGAVGPRAGGAGLRADPGGVLSRYRARAPLLRQEGPRTPAGDMSEPLRVGIVGGGAMVQVAHLPVLKKMKRIELARHLRHRPAQSARAGRPVRYQGRVRRHRGPAPL